MHAQISYVHFIIYIITHPCTDLIIMSTLSLTSSSLIHAQISYVHFIIDIFITHACTDLICPLDHLHLHHSCMHRSHMSTYHLHLHHSSTHRSHMSTLSLTSSSLMHAQISYVHLIIYIFITHPCTDLICPLDHLHLHHSSMHRSHLSTLSFTSSSLMHAQISYVHFIIYIFITHPCTDLICPLYHLHLHHSSMHKLSPLFCF